MGGEGTQRGGVTMYVTVKKPSPRRSREEAVKTNPWVLHVKKEALRGGYGRILVDPRLRFLGLRNEAWGPLKYGSR